MGPPKRKFSKQKRPQGKGKGKVQKASKLLNNDLEIEELKDKYDSIDVENIKTFADFPLSNKTQTALLEFKYIHPTEVQRHSIGVALQGKDVLGAAVTGSGKTLAFLIPVLEHLFINKWSRTDGVGAIIISPTRELAYQIFETLKKVGKNHDFSAGLIIGGKNLKFERNRMDQCNILICTPGRLLQHMDENPLFNTTTMEMLVLDEADRCLDMGFQKTLNSIIENFPPERQTLLYSATQTNSVKDLERLNLHDPVYVGYSKEAANVVLAVPELLQQSYVVLPLDQKITMLWSFVKNHLKQKTIVFVASCKQAKYLYEIFCKLRPGVSLLALYGTLHQDRRLAIYEEFLRKSHVVMFATDVASRGLDFPSVNWVLQLDCPEDVEQYVHRAGRSARNKSRGESLLVLTPSEEQHMIEAIREKLKWDLPRVHIDPKKLFSPRVKIEAFLAQFSELRATAQRAFVSYLKSVFLMRNKRVFNILSLDLDAYAQSLGLAVTPRVPFIDNFKWKSKQQQQQQGQQTTNGTTTTAAAFASNQNCNEDDEDDDDDDDDFIQLKRRDHEVEGAVVSVEEETEILEVPKREKLVTKAALAKKALKKQLQINSKVKFNEEGDTLTDSRNEMKALATKQHYNNNNNTKLQSKDDDGGISIVLSKALLNEEDAYDKQRFRELVKKRHKQQREKLKQKAIKEVEEDEDEEEHLQTINDNLDESGDESEHSVDLSWLPDPDKIYNTQKDEAAEKSGSEVQNDDDSDKDDVDDDSDDDSDDDDDSEEPAYKRSKLMNKLSLYDTEAIAANLLGS